MKIQTKLFSLLALAAGGAVLAGCAATYAAPEAVNAQATKALEAYPGQRDGFTRYVLELPERAHESDYKVQIFGGKTMQVDCNVHGMDGNFEVEDVKGFGYNYWVLHSQGNTRSTMMACPPDSEHDAFVRTQSQIIDYNSKLPVVVFVPTDMQLQYRIWTGSRAQDVQPD